MEYGYRHLPTYEEQIRLALGSRVRQQKLPMHSAGSVGHAGGEQDSSETFARFLEEALSAETPPEDLPYSPEFLHLLLDEPDINEWFPR
jgi:hypothetical protein